jgi:uncharacterized protein DUF3861
MKQHLYRITVEHLADAQGRPSPYGEPLSFEVGNHDDIFAIVERMRRRGDFDDTASTALAVGLKLFSEVMLENRSHPRFQSFVPHFSEFMKSLKTPTDRTR